MPVKLIIAKIAAGVAMLWLICELVFLVLVWTDEQPRTFKEYCSYMAHVTVSVTYGLLTVCAIILIVVALVRVFTFLGNVLTM